MRTSIVKNGVLVLFLGFFFATTAFASGIEKTPVETLRNKIVKLVQNPDLHSYDIQEETLKVSFIFNKSNEIVVLNVDTESTYLEAFVRNRLNYEKVNVDDLDTKTTYHIDIVFKKSY